MNNLPPDNEDSLEEQVGQIADEFSRELDQGNEPSIASYAVRYPHLTSKLRQVLPALMLMRAAARDSTSGAKQQTTLSSSIPLDGRLGDYRIIRELGRGGMGVVYEAEQLSLGRRVALKVLPSVAAFDGKQLQRFKNEAQTAAQLHHPHIVPIYGVGCEGDLHFYAMQVIDGQTLAGLIHNLRQKHAEKREFADSTSTQKEPTPSSSHLVPFRLAAELGVQAADALEHAHQVGILHRDIKPANLLIEKGSHLWITDFGLARLRGDSELTLSGDLLGTVRYMSPEQALARHALVDQRTDIYSLGITLYELLTLEPAFSGVERAELIHQVAYDEPLPPRSLNKAVPADLETIVLKAIAKNREERYLTAHEMADDLRRYLENRPILARRPSPWKRIRKWSERHKAVVATAVVCTVTALVALAVLDTRSRFQLQEKQQETTNALETVKSRNLEAEKARGEMVQTLVDTFTSTGLTAGERGEAGQAVLWFAHAARTAASSLTSDQGDDRDPQAGAAHARGYRERVQANRQRFRFWSRQIPAPVMAEALGSPIKEWSFRPGGDQLLVLSERGKCLILDVGARTTVDLQKPEQSITAAAWSADGSRYVLGHANGDVEIDAFPGGERIQSIEHAGPISCVAFGLGGNLLAVGSRQVRVWNCGQARFVTPAFVHPQPVKHLLFNAQGDRLVSACADGFARVFAVEPGTSQPNVAPLFAPLKNLGRTSGIEKPIKPLFVDHDRGLIVCDVDGAVWCDAASGKVLRRVATGNVSAVSPSEDGRHFVVCIGFVARMWTTDPPQPIGPPLVHTYGALASFVPDGQILLTSSSNKIYRWSAPEGKALDPLCLVHQEDIAHLLCSPSAQFFSTAQLDGMVRIWSYPGATADERTIPFQGMRSFVRAGPDGRLLLPPGASLWPNTLRRTRVYDIESGKPVGPFLEAGGLLTDAALSPDGKSAVTVASTAQILTDRYARSVTEGQAGRLQQWNWQSGQQLGEYIPLPGDPRNVAYSPDGSRLVVMCGGGQILLIESASGRVVKRLEHGGLSSSENIYSAIQFSPDGKLFATGGLVPVVRLWDAVTGESAAPPLKHLDHCRSVEFSRDGRYLLTASRDRSARVWDVASGRLAATALQHPAELFGAGFSPDGRLVVTACGDGMARVWDWQSGKMVCPALKQGDVVCAALFSPDGQTVFVVDRSGHARVWEFNTGKPLTPLLATGSDSWFPMTACFTADGKYGVASSENAPIAAIHLIDLVERDDLDDNEMVRLAELLSGFRLEAGGITGLTMSEWKTRWAYFWEKRPNPIELEPMRSIDWHRLQVQNFERARNLAGITWHLRRMVALEPGDARSHLRLGIAYGNQAQWQSARSELTEALRAEPGLGEAQERRAAVYAALGDNNRAIADYDAVIRAEPLNAAAILHRGAVLSRKKDFVRAIADYSAALELDPTIHAHGTVWLYLAQAHRGLDQIAEARQWLAKAIACFEREKLTGPERDYFQSLRKITEAVVNAPLAK